MGAVRTTWNAWTATGVSAAVMRGDWGAQDGLRPGRGDDGVAVRRGQRERPLREADGQAHPPVLQDGAARTVEPPDLRHRLPAGPWRRVRGASGPGGRGAAGRRPPPVAGRLPAPSPSRG